MTFSVPVFLLVAWKYHRNDFVFAVEAQAADGT